MPRKRSQEENAYNEACVALQRTQRAVEMKTNDLFEALIARREATDRYRIAAKSLKAARGG